MSEISLEQILSTCDHTLLKQESTWEQIKALCDDGIRYHTASVCISPCFVKQAKDYVGERLAVCTVIGFPNGSMTTASKVFETTDAVANGADEIDMVINIGWVKEGRYKDVQKEIEAIKEACRGRILKVIIETCLLTEEQKVRACKLSVKAGADFVKTSTGFSTGGAKAEDVALMRKTVGPEIGVKASGGIRTYEDAKKMIDAGANRLGCSAGIAIVTSAK